MSEEVVESFKELCKMLGGSLRKLKFDVWSCWFKEPRQLKVHTPPYGVIVEDAESKRSTLLPLITGSYEVDLGMPLSGHVSVTKPGLTNAVTEVEFKGNFRRITLNAKGEHFHLIFD